MKRRIHPTGRAAGFTLMEVLWTSTLAALIFMGAIQGISTVNQLNYSSAQHLVAYGLCRDRLEMMRATPFASLSMTNTAFATTTVNMTHLGGKNKVRLQGTVTCSITDFTVPTRKHCVVTVNWTYIGRSLHETLSGIIYDKSNQ